MRAKFGTTVTQTPMNPQTRLQTDQLPSMQYQGPTGLLNGAHGPPTCNVPRSRLSNREFEKWAQGPTENGYGCGSLGSDLSHDPTQERGRRHTGRRCLPQEGSPTARGVADAGPRGPRTEAGPQGTQRRTSNQPGAEAPWKTAARPVKGT